MATSEKSTRTVGVYSACVSLTAGYLDGYALLTVGTYVSFMSGNTTMSGLKVGQSQLHAALPPAAAISSFFIGVIAGTWMAHSKLKDPQKAVFAIAALLLAAFMALNRHHSINALVGIVLLSVSMGMVNPTFARVGAEAVSLTAVTGSLVKLGNHLVLAMRHETPKDAQGSWDTYLHRAAVEMSLWAGFLSGAALSGVVAARLGTLALLPPCAVLMLFAFIVRPELAKGTA